MDIEPRSTRVVFLLPGYTNDHGWNSSIIGAMDRARALGVEVSCVEGVEPESMHRMVEYHSSNGVTLLVAHGFQFGVPVLSAAQHYPDTCYLVTDQPPESSSIPCNVAFLRQRQEEGAFLCGRLAAWLTETSVVGFVGGPVIPTQVANAEAFRRGVHSLKSNIRVLCDYAGTFGETIQGQRIAGKQIDAGADIIMHTADVAGLGVIDVCRRRGRKAIGYIADQSALAPDLVATSLIVDVPFVVTTKVQEVLSGSFSDGLWEVGLAEGAITLAPFDRFVSSEAQMDIHMTQASIIAGSIIV